MATPSNKNHELAKELYLEVRKLTKTVKKTDWPYRTPNQSQVAHASGIATRIFRKDSSYEAIVAALEEFKEMNTGFKEKNLQDEILVSIAYFQANADHPEDALLTTQKIKDESARSGVEDSVAWSFIRTGNYGKAMEMARNFDTTNEDLQQGASRIVRSALTLMVTDGKTEEALEIARTRSNKEEAIEALCAIAEQIVRPKE